MKISFSFCGIYPGLITANETTGCCEVLGAEFITCKNDLTKRENMRSDIEDSMVDIRLEFENEDDDCDIYDDRYRYIYDFWPRKVLLSTSSLLHAICLMTADTRITSLLLYLTRVGIILTCVISKMFVSLLVRCLSLLTNCVTVL